jgi:hypothetical protein
MRPSGCVHERIVVRAGMTFYVADLRLEELRLRTADLESLQGSIPEGATNRTQAFAH